MNRIMISACAAMALVVSAAALSDEPVQVDLSKGFWNPPASARPHTWWHWINGNESTRGITADLEAMKRIGIGGAQIFMLALIGEYVSRTFVQTKARPLYFLREIVGTSRPAETKAKRKVAAKTPA